jgi:hypothetical protein
MPRKRSNRTAEFKHPGPLVFVRWVDSHSRHAGWSRADDIYGLGSPLPCESVGWVLVDNDEVLVVVPHLAGCNIECIQSVCGEMTIPKSAIVTRKILDSGRSK